MTTDPDSAARIVGLVVIGLCGLALVAYVVVSIILFRWERAELNGHFQRAFGGYTHADLKRDLMDPEVSIEDILIRCGGRFPEKPSLELSIGASLACMTYLILSSLSARRWI